MSLILNIDTALTFGSISLSDKGRSIEVRKNDKETDHASWLHTAMAEIMNECGYGFNDLKSVAVSNGPGSYTGLRIGLATAKGLCYALGIPLITIPTLDIMAKAALDFVPEEQIKKADLLCPMIDARRMEVYFSIYDTQLHLVQAPIAAALDRYDMSGLINERTTIFFGNGSIKLKATLDNPNAFFTNFPFFGALHMPEISLQYYDNSRFSDIESTEPLYIKEFYDNR